NRCSLSMISRGISHHAAIQLLAQKRQNQVGSTADFECASTLKVFTFEQGRHAGLMVEAARCENRCSACKRPDPFGRSANVGCGNWDKISIQGASPRRSARPDRYGTVRNFR